MWITLAPVKIVEKSIRFEWLLPTRRKERPSKLRAGEGWGTRLRRHSFDTFLDEKPSMAQGGRV